MKITQQPFLVRVTLILISILCLGFILVVGQSILAPLFFAFLLALLFLPFNRFLELKLRFPRLLSTFISVAFILTMLFGLTSFFSSQLASFGNDIPHLEQRFEVLLEDLQNWIFNSFHINADKQLDYLNEGLDKLLSSSGSIISTTLSIFSSSLEFLFFTIIFFIFFLSYRKTLNRFIVNVFKTEYQDEVRVVVKSVKHMSKKYLLGIMIQIGIITFITSLVLWMLGVKYAILLGVLTGLLNVIPYVGIFISVALSCLFAFATSYPMASLYVCFAYLIIHVIDANLIVPFIIGSKVKINAFVTFLGILVGASLWGVAGMFLCIPALAIFKIMFEQIPGMEEWGRLLGEE